MIHKIGFTKMHGAGNDYIYVNTLLYNIPDPSAEAIKWSAPHFGIGSDGLVLIGKPSAGIDADYSMRIFNADGSEAMMCGNASRCIGKYLHDKGMTDKKEIRLETKSGVKILKLNIDEEGKVDKVTVDMLEPRFDVPEQYSPDKVADLGLEKSEYGLAGNVRCSTFVSMGNPHFVIFVDDLSKVDIAEEGKRLEFNPAFPQRCNIEFAQITDINEIKTRVWERGSGITMACGTGACATAVAAALNHLTSRESDIIMDGGKLHIRWGEDDNHVYMTGPAAFAFEGEIEL